MADDGWQEGEETVDKSLVVVAWVKLSTVPVFQYSTHACATGMSCSLLARSGQHKEGHQGAEAAGRKGGSQGPEAGRWQEEQQEEEQEERYALGPSVSSQFECVCLLVCQSSPLPPLLLSSLSSTAPSEAVKQLVRGCTRVCVLCLCLCLCACATLHLVQHSHACAHHLTLLLSCVCAQAQEQAQAQAQQNKSKGGKNSTPNNNNNTNEVAVALLYTRPCHTTKPPHSLPSSLVHSPVQRHQGEEGRCQSRQQRRL